MANVRSFAPLLPIAGIAGALAWAGSQNGVRLDGQPPLFALCGALAFAVNWLAFVPAHARQTERYYDLVGSLTYLTLVGVALAAGPRDPRSLLLAGLVGLWALRLGSFLFRRILEDGSDGRFDRIKPSFARFFVTWSLQALWVFVTLSCGLAAMTSTSPVPLGPLAGLGSAIWLLGFGLEVVADRQKRAFRRSQGSERFIDSGLWAWSQHPNYFGEITLWIGVALVALPGLRGWQLVTLVSPVFVFVLLTRISGIPLLAARARRRWGDDPAYRAYRQRTPLLVPRPPRSAPEPSSSGS